MSDSEDNTWASRKPWNKCSMDSDEKEDWVNRRLWSTEELCFLCTQIYPDDCFPDSIEQWESCMRQIEQAIVLGSLKVSKAYGKQWLEPKKATAWGRSNFSNLFPIFPEDFKLRKPEERPVERKHLTLLIGCLAKILSNKVRGLTYKDAPIVDRIVKEIELLGDFKGLSRATVHRKISEGLRQLSKFENNCDYKSNK